MDDPETGDDRSGGHELLDHTSEIVVRLHAASFGALIAEAARAFLSLVPEELGRQPAPHAKELELEADDAAATLVDWINELVFLAEVERWIPSEISVREKTGTDTRSGRGPVFRVCASGQTLERPFVFVKAATLHGVDVRRGPDGVEAEVTLDV